MIYIIWKECMPHRFYQHICKEKNFFYLNGKNVLQPKVLEKKKKENYNDVRNNSRYKNILQYVYSNVSRRFTVQPKGEASTFKAISTLYLKLTRARKN